MIGVFFCLPEKCIGKEDSATETTEHGKEEHE